MTLQMQQAELNLTKTWYLAFRGNLGSAHTNCRFFLKMKRGKVRDSLLGLNQLSGVLRTRKKESVAIPPLEVREHCLLGLDSPKLQASSRTLKAKCTVLVIQLFLTNCIQAHDNCLKVLLHINLYFSTRRPRTIGSTGHVNFQSFEIMCFQEFCLSRPGHFSKKSTKNHQKKICRATPGTPLLAGLRPSHPPR